MTRLSAADKLMAGFLASETKARGPLTKDQVSELADHPPVSSQYKSLTLSFALTNLAEKMQPGEVVTKAAVPWWKRL